MKLLVIAEGVLARAGLAALLTDVSDAEVAGQIAPLDGLADEIDLYEPDAVVFDLGYDAARWLSSVSALTVPALLLLPDENAAYTVSAALPAGLPVALLLREGDPRRLEYALNALEAGLVTLDPALAAVLLPSGGAVDEPPAEKLTAREVEVLRLMADGLTNKAIGAQLQISPNTVKYHVNTILSKLGAQSRTEAVVRGGRLGLIML
jgi:DNA-binding NarL/FixJ family response regulator